MNERELAKSVINRSDLKRRTFGHCSCTHHFLDLESRIVELLLTYRKQVVENCAKIAENHYEEHCCEDCPCDHWRENTAAAIREVGA